MKRRNINFNPSPDDILNAVDFMSDPENYAEIVQFASNGDEHATSLFGAWLDYLADRPRCRVWLVHFHAVYRASREVRS